MSSVAALSTRIRSGSPVLSAWCGIPEPGIAGLLAREAFDAVTLDMQHGAVDVSGVFRALPLIAAAGKPALVRIPVGEFATASRVLDAGASAVIAPMINTVEDARLFGSFVKYPPVGDRSWGPHGALSLTGSQPGDYLAQANGFCLSFAMVETRESLGRVDDILAAPGLDGIFLGPSDLSLALSGGARINPLMAEVDHALDHAFARARAAGKLIGVYAGTGERASQVVEKGFDLVAVASDTLMLRSGAQATLKAARS